MRVLRSLSHSLCVGRDSNPQARWAGLFKSPLVTDFNTHASCLPFTPQHATLLVTTSMGGLQAVTARAKNPQVLEPIVG